MNIFVYIQILLILNFVLLLAFVVWCFFKIRSIEFISMHSGLASAYTLKRLEEFLETVEFVDDENLEDVEEISSKCSKD